MQNPNLTQAIKDAYPALPPPRTLLTVRQFSDKHPAFTQGSLRNLIFLANNRKTSQGTIQGNGLNVALVRIGRKLLIDEAKFFQWIDQQQENFK
ncbi:hypothetical protein [Nitrosomonas ureae]|uniref:Uncharacterized protein n=1 Tax=Nitrosomonas ureae TaxID=44577 RepID=A0A2T5IRM5_9PROT|nr:hypothetical protein [Nitrosomonas ureae]PTQ86475.1 hypothetical protein C8R28_101051 [Nitrosomonas ureae]